MGQCAHCLPTWGCLGRGHKDYIEKMLSSYVPDCGCQNTCFAEGLFCHTRKQHDLWQTTCSRNRSWNGAPVVQRIWVSWGAVFCGFLRISAAKICASQTLAQQNRTIVIACPRGIDSKIARILAERQGSRLRDRSSELQIRFTSDVRNTAVAHPR